MHAAWDEHDEHPVAARDRPLDDVAIVGGAGHDIDPALELGELADALLTAHDDHLVPAVERVLDHVLPELAGPTDDAGPHESPGAGFGPVRSTAVVSGSGSCSPMSRRNGGYVSVISAA